MPLKYLIDENLRGKLSRSLPARALEAGLAVDCVTVGGEGGPALGMGDPELLRWAKEEGRVIISLDRNTLLAHLAMHLSAGLSSPGILLVRAGCSWEEVLDYLVIASALASEEEFGDRCSYLP